MKKFTLALCLFPILLITVCSEKKKKKACHITTGGQEFVYPDFNKEACDQEVQSLIDKGMIDAQSEWKVPAK